MHGLKQFFHLIIFGMSGMSFNKKLQTVILKIESNCARYETLGTYAKSYLWFESISISEQPFVCPI